MLKVDESTFLSPRKMHRVAKTGRKGQVPVVCLGYITYYSTIYYVLGRVASGNAANGLSPLTAALISTAIEGDN